MNKRCAIILVIILQSIITIGQGIVISEIFAGGASTGATYKNDYVELYNPTNDPITMTNWSVQYASSTGTSWIVGTLNATIPAKSFYLVKCNGGTSGLDLSNFDATANLSLQANNGKIALCNTTTALSGANPTGSNIVDKVGYGSANGFETMATPALTTTTAIERKANSLSTASSMASGGGDNLAGNGYDSNNNSTDFVIVSPDPQYSGSPAEPVGGVSGPTLSYSPSSINFGSVILGNQITSYYILTGQNLEGDVNLSYSGDATFTISKSLVGPFSSSLVFSAAELASPDTVFVHFNPGSAGASSGNIVHTTMNFSGTNIVSLSGNGLVPGALSFNFDNCTSSLTDFTAFSVTGAQVWACTNFGHNASDPSMDSPNGVQMNGFSGSNNVNEDWLISPQVPISGDMNKYPLLSFWNRTRFNGAPLTLKVSSNYSGAGSPANATWVDLPASFAAENSDIWTHTENVDLSAFRGQNIFVAFVYTSTASDGARWTLDDISFFSSDTPPPPQLNATPLALNFGYKAPGSTNISSISLSGQHLTSDVSLSVNGPFSISTDSINFGQNLIIPASQINQTKVFVRFIPQSTNQNFSGSVSASSSGLDPIIIILSGNTFDPANTLDIVGWNIEWFSGINGPSNDLLQEMNALEVLTNLNADIYACPEIVDTLAFKNLADELGSPGEYGYYISKYASAVPNEFSPTYGDAQKLGFIYRKSVISPTNVTALFYTTDVNSSAYNYWASGRFPLMMETMTTINGITYPVAYILIHAKAQNSANAYERRKNASLLLKGYLDSLKANERFIILGDYNDDLDQTIAAPGESSPFYPASSYSDLVNDSLNYKAVTLPLSLSNQKSTVGYNDVIDHAIVSNELGLEYIANSAKIITEVNDWIPNYGSTTSDHYPVMTSYSFSQSPLPVRFIKIAASANGTQAIIKWSVNNAIDCQSFTVEKSLDGISWQKLGETNCLNERNKAHYEFPDVTFNKKTSYYRVVATDVDGAENVSKIAYLHGDGFEQEISLYPNPALNQTQLVNAPSFYTYSIYNSFGSLLLENKNTGDNIDLSSMPSGMYILQVSYLGGTKSLKLVKN
ncbi:MAG: choice-of-anchor J domain-containing protein [Saprospiraceae bacterium]|nr:choice-of-anchor J domain-containing protein [Saprospiraceae bacterium]